MHNTLSYIIENIELLYLVLLACRQKTEIQVAA